MFTHSTALIEPESLAIQTDGLGKLFGTRAALEGVDLEVPRGAAFGFLGPNGAGKTTLIRLLLGLAEPTAGRMRLLGRDLPGGHAEALARVGAIIDLGVLLVLVCGIAVGYSAALTYLWNRTASVVPCILLHASFNTANGMAGLQSEDDLVEGAYATITLCLTGTLVVLMLLLVHRTRGQLGLDKAAGARTATPSARQSAAS